MITTIALAITLNVSGTYFESRNCSIKAGPCHYSGEVMTDGNTCVLVYRFEQGHSNSADLGGASAAVVITGDKSFAFNAPRRSSLYFDGSKAQVDAIRQILKAELAGKMGDVVSESSAKITVQGGSVRVVQNSSEVFSLETNERECLACSMPGVVWFEPLSPGVEAKVSTVEQQKLNVSQLDQRWTRTDEAAAFVGRFHW